MDPSQTAGAAVTVKREVEDDIPQQTMEDYVRGHRDLAEVELIYRSGQRGTQNCAFAIPQGDQYVAEKDGTLKICRSIKTQAPSKKSPVKKSTAHDRAPKTFIVELAAATNALAVATKALKGAAARVLNRLIRKAASFLKLWDAVRALPAAQATSGIEDMAHAKKIVALAPPAVFVKLSPSPRKQHASVNPSLRCSPSDPSLALSHTHSLSLALSGSGSRSLALSHTHTLWLSLSLARSRSLTH